MFESFALCYITSKITEQNIQNNDVFIGFQKIHVYLEVAKAWAEEECFMRNSLETVQLVNLAVLLVPIMQFITR